MKTDPRTACANEEEKFGWALLHDLVAHQLMALTGWAGWALRFHDWTSHHAWPRASVLPGEWVEVSDWWYVYLDVRETSVPGLYQIKCPFMDHVYGVKALNHADAAELGSEWFRVLEDEI